ncbi:hypothetical protein Tco_1564142, partial [Tanacetum coccineum]
IHNIDQDIQQAEHEYDESRVVVELRCRNITMHNSWDSVQKVPPP